MSSGFSLDLRTGSDRARGSPHFKVVLEPRFKRFYKVILKLFVNYFEIVYDMHCISI